MPEHRPNTKTPITLRDRSLCLFGVLIRSIFDMYVIDADGSNLVTPADRPAFDGGPAWSPDNQKIAFSSGVEWDKVEVFFNSCGGIGGICVMNADGNNLVSIANGIGMKESTAARTGHQTARKSLFHLDAMVIVKSL